MNRLNWNLVQVWLQTTARTLRAARKTEGGAMVEMAVTLPLILLIMTAIFSFSIALYQKLMLAEAVSNGGRVLALERGDGDPCKKTASAIYAAAPGLDPNKITLTFVLDGTTYSGASCNGTTSMNEGHDAQVIASYPCSLKVYGVHYASCKMTSQITEVVQ